MSTRNRTFVFRLFGVFVLLTLLLGASGVTPAHGGGGIRYVKPSAAGTGDCLSWANACTLQTALTGAISGNHVWVIAGTHKPTTGTSRFATFQLKSGVTVLGGFNGTEVGIEDEDKRDPVTNVTILSGEIGAAGNSDNSYHVVTGVTGATLDGFIITAGNANYSVSPNSRGGGMYNNSSSPMLTNITFSANSAGYGGGMYNDSSSPTLTNITFSANSAYTGGGMCNWSSSPTLMSVTFTGNSANVGGGIFNESGSPMLTNITFSNNSSSYGGGMYNHHSSPTLTNVTFSANSASYGGGMHNDLGSIPRIDNTIFWGNTASTAGAQIDNDSNPAIVNDSVVQDGYAGGTNIISANPMLGALGNYGGFTQTIPLLAGSSAIDTGNDASCPATDQRGIARPQRAHCDIGAYEAKAVETLTLNSIGTQDGWILESGENTNAGGTMSATAATLTLGDNAQKKQYRSILSFKTSNLPDNAVITKVTLKLKHSSVSPAGTNPINLLQGIYIDLRKGFFGTSAGLQLTDFQATQSKTVGPSKPVLTTGWYTISLNSTTFASINKLASNGGLTQIRLRFKLDDNNDTIANILNIVSGNNATAANRPTLLIEYYVP